MPIDTDEPTAGSRPYQRAGSGARVVRQRAAEYNAQPEPERVSLDEYLAAEEVAEHRSEFIDGVVRAMPQTTLQHGLIVQNVASELGNQLRGSPCRVVSQGTHVRIEGVEVAVQ